MECSRQLRHVRVAMDAISTENDRHLRERVLSALENEPGVDHTQLAVQAKDGAVTLKGHLRDQVGKENAIRTVRRVPGVRAVADEILVGAATTPVSDSQLALEAAHHLDSIPSLSQGGVQAVVRNGRLRLQGEVDSLHECIVAERSVQDIPGVREVVNTIVVRPTDLPEDIVVSSASHAGLRARAIPA